MDGDTGKILSRILGKGDLEKVPADILVKVEKFYDQHFEEFLTTKAKYDIAKRNVDELQTKYDVVNTRSQDSDAKIESAQQNVVELRQQLEVSKSECRTLSESVHRLEAEVSTFRKERNDAYDERDQLLKMSDRQTINIERLQSDVSTLDGQLQAAIAAKCEAVVRCDEIEAREHSIEQREKFIEHERTMLQAQIVQLRDSLNKNMAEMQTIRHESNVARLQMETELAHKTEELKIAMSQVGQYAETNQELVNQTESLNVKLKEQNDESTKMMEHYQRELQAKDQLCELYKAGSLDNEAEKSELKAAIDSLKKMLSEVSVEYGQMETKLRDIDVEHQKQLAAKDATLQELRDEISNANDLLKIAKDENIEQVLERMTPTAAAASRRLKTGMTLTQIYNLYVKAAQDLNLKERECNQMEVQLKAIVQELKERAPEWKRQEIECQNVMASNEELNQQLDKLINERVSIRAEVAEASDKYKHMERENKQLTASQNDLSRQVCYLLKEIEQMRRGFSTEHDQSISSNMSASEVISKKLVTFNDIVELQENNQKLLLLVRDLSSRLEELEEQHATINLAAYEEQIAQFKKRFAEMERTAEKQNKLSADCIKQKDRYKRLYYEIMSDVGKVPQSLEGSVNNEAMEEDSAASSRTAEPDGTVTVNGSQAAALDAKDKRIAELDEQIKDHVTQLKQLREEYVEYRKEKNANDKVFNEQFQQMRQEVRELTSTNCHLTSSVTFHSEQIKIQQKNVAVYKKQIQTLEERDRNYDKTLAKNEQTILYLRDQTMQMQQRSSTAEIKCEELQRLARKLQDDVSRLTIERDTLYRERHSQNLLQNNLELIKTTFERSENDGRIRMEQRFDEAQRECSALRRRLQEEQDNFRELAADLKRQTDTAIQKMTDEQAHGDSLRKQIEELRLDTEQKSNQISNLSQKLQESLTPSKSDNPIAAANKRIKELQLQVELHTTDLEQLRKEYATAQTMVDQMSKVANEYESVSKEVQEQFDDFRSKATAELDALRLSETNLKLRIDEQDTEIRLQITGAQINTTDTTTELHKAQTELKECLEKISENNRELRELRSECQILKGSLQSVEQKYSNEMMLHSADINVLTQFKDEMNKIRDQLNALRVERDTSVAALQSYRNEWDSVSGRHSAEKQELEVRMKDLDSYNGSLLDQLQALNNKMSVSRNESLNESTMADSSFVNRSITDEDAVPSDQQHTIIKYLRKAKDLAVSNVEILQAENVRLRTEAEMLSKRLAEANERSMSAERPASDLSVVSAAKHEEILRKVETLNAITDSNRFLREERDSLNMRVQELTSRVTKLEDDLFPLQEKNRELLVKTEEQTTEIQSSRREAEQWRRRANNLVERTNKNPEDFKRLQNERENLAKMLTAESDKYRALTEELAGLRIEKARVDGEVVALQSQHQTVADEKKKLGDEFVALRQQSTRMGQEILELKNQLLIKDGELKKLVDALTIKDTVLTDIKGKESKVRVIAKRYKDLYYELKVKTDASEADMSARPLADQVASADQAAASAQRAEAEQATAARLVELTAQLAALKAELEKLRAENEALKGRDDTSTQLQEARARIKALTEAHANITREFQSSKSQLQTCEQSRSEHDLLVTGLKSQCDGRINRLEKEMADLDAANKEIIGRLTRENETLNHRVHQFHRQLQSQGSKPSTSSGPTEKGPSDAARTANVKPMAGPSGQQSAAVTPRRGGDTPLASIRPMSVQNSRTAAVLPTSQSSNVAALQGASTGSVTALVPPQQQVHTTGQSSTSSAEAMSSSPTSSHTDYMPATSSAVVVAVPPMGSAATSAESSQEAESAPCSANVNDPHASSQAIVGQQQTVALVSPRIELSPQSAAAVSAAAVQQQVAPQPSPQHQVSEQNQAAASTSGGSSSSSSSTSSSSVAMSTHHQASSSNTVTTTQAAGHKRPRDPEGDSSTGVEESSASVSSDANKTSPKNKRTRLAEQTFQGVSESGIDVEYQVPTSSQRDQEDDNVIVVDSEEEDEDDGMVDEGPAEQFEEESYDQEQDDEGEGPDIDEDNDGHRDTNEVEVDDSSDVPNQSVAQASASDVGTSGGGSGNGHEQLIQMAMSPQNAAETQQIQTISSGSEARSSTWGSGQSSAQNLILQQVFEETGDDSIVPSTPTLYTTRRTDGFSEAVSSPHPQVPQQHAARFSFTDQVGHSSTVARPNVAGSSGQLELMLDDTRVDLQLDQSVSDVSRMPAANTSPLVVHQQVSPSTQRQAPSDQHQSAAAADAAVLEIQLDTTDAPDESPEQTDEVAGPSGSSSMAVDASQAPEDANDSASTSEAAMDVSKEDNSEDQGIDDDVGADGVTSEGEKVQNEEIQVEEGREAEASIQTPNTRSRSTPRNRGRGGRAGRGASADRAAPIDRRTLIVWDDNSQQAQQDEAGSPSTGTSSPRGRGGRRTRRPQGRF